MAKIAVIYKSNYGSTKQYAEWIAEALEASLFEASSIKPAQLMDYDVVIYGGGLYAGGINGAKLVAKSPCKTLILFTVGYADPKNTNYSAASLKPFTPEQLANLKMFHFRGAMDYEKLGLIHKGMMAAVRKVIQKKPIEKREGWESAIIESYGSKINLIDKSTIEPLVEYVRTL